MRPGSLLYFRMLSSPPFFGTRGLEGFFMANRNLLRQFDLDESQQQELEDIFREDWLPEEKEEKEVNKIVTGKVLRIAGDEVWIDVNFKSEGAVPLNEWYDEGLDKVVPPNPGDMVQV